MLTDRLIAILEFLLYSGSIGFVLVCLFHDLWKIIPTKIKNRAKMIGLLLRIIRWTLCGKVKELHVKGEIR